MKKKKKTRKSNPFLSRQHNGFEISFKNEGNQKLNVIGIKPNVVKCLDEYIKRTGK